MPTAKTLAMSMIQKRHHGGHEQRLRSRDQHLTTPRRIFFITDIRSALAIDENLPSIDVNYLTWVDIPPMTSKQKMLREFKMVTGDLAEVSPTC